MQDQCPKRFVLRYLGHRPGAALAYFTGASVTLERGHELEVPAGGLVIGRAPEAGLRVASAWVARAHARVRPVPDGLEVEDLGSTNGTAINDVPTTRGVLHPGDRLTIAAGFDFEVAVADQWPT
jgi:pSer/pThr/pTyr-binding forkhead associated (FHA) protein